MQSRVGTAVVSMLLVLAALGGCAGTGGSGGYTTFMQRCVQNAKTEEERSECAWKNAERNASGR